MADVDQLRAEADLLTQWADHVQELNQTRAAYQANRDDPAARDAHLAQQEKVHQFRSYWRQIGEAVGTRTPAPTASAAGTTGEGA